MSVLSIVLSLILSVFTNVVASPEMEKAFKSATQMASSSASEITSAESLKGELDQHSVESYKSMQYEKGVNESNIDAKVSRQAQQRGFFGKGSVKEFFSKQEADLNSSKAKEKDAMASLITDGVKIADKPEVVFTKKSVGKTERIKVEAVKKTCKVSPEFEIKINMKLRYSVPERLRRRTKLVMYYPAYLKKVGAKHDDIAPLRVQDRNQNINIERFRKYGCPHFTPIDALTNQEHKIDCHRIKNFMMTRVVDKSREHIVDCYGQKINPVKYIEIEYEHDTYQGDEVLKDKVWSYPSEDMGEKLAKYNCTLKKDICVDRGPRSIDELTITDTCWEKELTYACGLNINTCQDVEGRGCDPWSKECLQEIDGFCGLWEKKYNCKKRVLKKNAKIGGSAPYCLGGDCNVVTEEADQDFAEVSSRLAMLEDMQANLQREGNSIVGVFGGENKGCNVHLANFKNCCGVSKGWGVSLGLNKCGANEIELSKRRGKGQCRYIGSYCAEKIPLTGICLRRRQTFCCFGSKLARVFQEKGREFLGKGWGNPKDPDCRSFSLNEMENIDWTDMDLSEVYDDLAQKVAPQKGQKRYTNKKPSLQKRAESNKEENRKNGFSF